MTATTEEIIEIVKKRAKSAATVTETSHLYEDLWISTSTAATAPTPAMERKVKL